MATVKETIKANQEAKFKEEIRTIKYRLVESMTNIDLHKNERTERLYARLGDAFDELLEVEKKLT